MTRTVPQHWLLFVGPDNTGLAVQLELDKKKNGEPFFFSMGPVGKRLDIELKTSENNNSALIDAYGDLENSAKNGGSYGYAFLQSEGHLRNEASFRFQFEKEYLKGDKLQNVSGASASLLFGLAVVTAVRSDLEYRPFAATGILSDGGQVQPIEGLQAKIRAALNTPALRGSGVIFYPKANDKDIDAELRYEVKRAQIALKPVESLEEAVEYLGIPIQGHWIGNPYRRLDVFEYRHRRIFFGREDVTEPLAIKLSDRATLERPSLLILGPSGAGKSSLVQAGLIPELEKRFKEENLSLLYSIFDLKSAANKDIQAIATSIRSSWSLLPGLSAMAVSNASKQQVAVTPSDVFEALVCDLITFLPNQTRFVWVLDQLEQFFTLGLTKEADAAFIHLLRELQARGIWIVATFRNDFYSDLRAHDGISSIFDKDGVHDLEKPGETAIERIIQAPAELARLEFEKDDQKSELLSLRLKNDALRGGRDILPLLEFALDQLYEKRELKNGRTQLTWAAYEAMGGLQGAIGERADEVLSKLDPAEQETLGRVLRALAKLRRDTVETEGEKSTFIASVANLENFPADTPARRLINAFAHEKARLFTRDSDNKGIAQVRVTHEALFTHWKKAHGILKDSMKDMVVRDRLADNEVDWRLNEKHESKLLPSGLPLEEAQDLFARRRDEKFLSPEIIHFIEQSSSADLERKLKESEAQRRKTRLTTVTAIVLGILLVVAIGAIYYVNQARNEQAQMLASSYFSEGARLVDEGRSNEALAYLAQAIRLNSNAESPSVYLAASLLLPSKNSVGIKLSRIPNFLQLNPNMDSVIIAPSDETVQILDFFTQYPMSKPMKHEAKVTSATFSPDGSRVITTSMDKTARVWEVATGIPISPPIRHKSYVRSAKFSPNGKWVITFSDYGIAQIWDSETGVSILSKPLQHERGVSSANFSPDGRWVIVVSTDRTRAWIWETATGNLILLPFENQDYVKSAQFSSDGQRILIVGNDNTVRVWDVTKKTLVSQLVSEKNDIKSAHFSPNGRLVVTNSWNKMVQVWDPITGKKVSKTMEHESYIQSVQFSPDGRWIVTASMDGTVKVWEAVTGKRISYMNHEDVVDYSGFSPDSRWVVTISRSKKVQIWNSETGERILQPLRHEEFVDLALFSQDGRQLITITSDKIAHVWNILPRSSLSQPIIINSNYRRLISEDIIHFSADERLLVTTSGDSLAWIWEVTTGKPILQLSVPGTFITSAQFSPDGCSVVTISNNKVARVWDSRTGKPVSELTGHLYGINSAQFSPDGRLIITASIDTTALIRDSKTGDPILTKPLQHAGTVNSANFSSDGRWVVTASSDATAQTWEVTTGKPVSQPMEHRANVTSAQFSPDGRWVLTASWDKTARVWESATGKPVSQPMSHMDRVDSAQFSPDGRWVVTASEDNTARVWNSLTGEPISLPMKHWNPVKSALFDSTGKKVVTTSWDNRARIWDAQTGHLISIPYEYQQQVDLAKFSKDNRHILIGSDNIYIQEIPQFPIINKGFVEFLERVSGYSVNDSNVLQPKYKNLALSELHQWAAVNSDFTQEERNFIDWWFSDPIERTVTPTSKQTVKERVQMLIDHDTIASLNEALDYYPGHPMALAKLAAATWRETKTDQQDDIRPRVALWANLALKYATDDTAVRTVAEKVLQDIAQQN